MAVNEPPEAEVDEPKPPARLGRGGSISCCSKGRSFEKKFSHATLASDEGGGLAGDVPALARREAVPLTLTRGEADAAPMCFSVADVLDAEDDEEAAELLLLEEDELPPLAGVEELFDLDEERTDEETRRDDGRAERGPQLEMKPRVDVEVDVAIAGALRLCVPACLSKARA